MRELGWLFTIGGVIYLIVAFNMDVSVTSSTTYVPGYGSVGGESVANLDLMARRQNHVIVAALITLVGALILVFGNKDENAEEGIGSERVATPDTYVGDRSLEDDGYRLWLARHHGIERNDVFQRFEMNATIYETLDDALSAAHRRELDKIEVEAAKNLEKAEREERESEQIRLDNEKAEAEWEAARPKLAAILVISIVVFVTLYFVVRETPEEREARITQSRAEAQQLRDDIEKKFGVSLPEDAENIVVSDPTEAMTDVCDSIRNGELLEFTSSLSESALHAKFVDILGEGEPYYGAELLDDYDTKWLGDGSGYALQMFDMGGSTNVYFCVGESRL